MAWSQKIWVLNLFLKRAVYNVETNIICSQKKHELEKTDTERKLKETDKQRKKVKRDRQT